LGHFYKLKMGWAVYILVFRFPQTQKCVWHKFWAIFSQTHLVTLPVSWLRWLLCQVERAIAAYQTSAREIPSYACMYACTYRA
jgi:hypothetical protein